jgi:hypothetical protein
VAKALLLQRLARAKLAHGPVTQQGDDLMLSLNGASDRGAAVVALGAVPDTDPVDDTENACVVTSDRQGQQRFLLGPTALGGADVVSAKAQFQEGTGWAVVNGVVVSNPMFQASSFSGPVQFTGGQSGFTRKQAVELAKVALAASSVSPLTDYEIKSITAG